MKKDFKKEVLKEIKDKEIKQTPKSFFQIVAVLIWVFTAGIGIMAIYLVNLSFYLPRRGLTISQMLERPIILSSIPWALLLIAAVAIGLLSFIFIRYEGGYKKNIFWTIVIISLLAILGGALVSASRLNEALEMRRGIRMMYDATEMRFVPGQGKMRRDFLEQKKRQLEQGLESGKLPFNPAMLKDYN